MLQVAISRPRRSLDLYLFVAVESIEGVKKFLLRPLLPAEELNIVDQEQIRLPVTFAEFHQSVVLDGVDEFVDKEFARQVHHPRRFLFRPDVLADRLHQVRLSESDAAINKERIVCARGRLRDCQAGRVCNLIVRTNDE